MLQDLNKPKSKDKVKSRARGQRVGIPEARSYRGTRHPIGQMIVSIGNDV